MSTGNRCWRIAQQPFLCGLHYLRAYLFGRGGGDSQRWPPRGMIIMPKAHLSYCGCEFSSYVDDVRKKLEIYCRLPCNIICVTTRTGESMPRGVYSVSENFFCA